MVQWQKRGWRWSLDVTWILSLLPFSPGAPTAAKTAHNVSRRKPPALGQTTGWKAQQQWECVWLVFPSLPRFLPPPPPASSCPLMLHYLLQSVCDTGRKKRAIFCQDTLGVILLFLVAPAMMNWASHNSHLCPRAKEGFVNLHIDNEENVKLLNFIIGSICLLSYIQWTMCW